MVTNKYLKWLSETDGYWWTDSADYATMDEAIGNGATGVTTNPILVKKSLYSFPEFWRPYLKSAEGLSGDAKAEEIIRCITVMIAKKYEHIYNETKGVQSYVCAQVNPEKQGDTAAMIEMGRRLAAWAPNIAVKIPATAAGLRAIEELAAEGITTCGTVSFTTPQAVAIAAAQQRGIDRCRAAGICNSDVHTIADERSVSIPVVLGHEYVGQVVEVCGDVGDFRVGDWVTSLPACYSCGDCWLCNNGLVTLCRERKSIGSHRNGAMANYVVVPAKYTFKIPNSAVTLDDKAVYALTEPLACMVRGIYEKQT